MGEVSSRLPGQDSPADVAAAPSRWRRLRRRALAAAVVGLVLVLAHRPLLVGFASLFRVDDPAPSDALVVLIGGADHRAAKAAELYRRGLAPTVLVGESGVMPVLEFDQTELIRRFLVREGVPAEAVRVLPGGVVTSTRDEALRMRDYARGHPLRRITVVTTASHTCRARWIFRKTLRGLGVDVRMAAARHPRFDESDWYRNEDGLVAYFEELIKTLFYLVSY